MKQKTMKQEAKVEAVKVKDCVTGWNMAVNVWDADGKCLDDYEAFKYYQGLTVEQVTEIRAEVWNWLDRGELTLKVNDCRVEIIYGDCLPSDIMNKDLDRFYQCKDFGHKRPAHIWRQ